MAVGISGGVDSSAAAYLLKKRGYDVVGVYIQCWESKADGCTANEDRASAVAVCAHLGIKFVHLDFISQYKAKVIEYFYREYEVGRTPNPDVMCNKEIKFGLFLEWAMKNGFDYVATGHYARVEAVGNGVESSDAADGDGGFKLLKGVDETKDQSYFLYLLGQEVLARTLFPLGELKKSEVREIAGKVGLPTYNRPDSMGICFIGDIDVRKFLEERIAPKKGEVVSGDGEVIGEHGGAWFYTIGQRHGFTITKYQGLPMYVVDKNVEENVVVVGPIGQTSKDCFEVEKVHWIGGSPEFPLDCEVRVRHLGKLARCTISPSLSVKLETPIFGIAPGQSAVFYAGDEVLGGGVICK